MSRGEGEGQREVGSGKWDVGMGKNQNGDRMMDYEEENTVFADNGADCAVAVPAADTAATPAIRDTVGRVARPSCRR